MSDTSELDRPQRPSLTVQLGRFPERLKEAIGEESVRSFANKCAQSDGVLRKYLNGETLPTLDRVEKIAQAANVSPVWLAFGMGEKKLGIGGISESQENYKTTQDFALVPRYNVQASAGPGADVHSEQIVDFLAFKRTWLRELDLQENCLALITARGDSMLPTIKDESLLLVDTREGLPLREGIYVLRMDGVLLAKRLQRLLDGAILIKSDNSVYQEIKAEKEQIQLLNIVGRVVWTGSKL